MLGAIFDVGDMQTILVAVPRLGEVSCSSCIASMQANLTVLDDVLQKQIYVLREG